MQPPYDLSSILVQWLFDADSVTCPETYHGFRDSAVKLDLQALRHTCLSGLTDVFVLKKAQPILFL